MFHSLPFTIIIGWKCISKKQLVFTRSHNPALPSWPCLIVTISERCWLQYGCAPKLQIKPSCIENVDFLSLHQSNKEQRLQPYNFIDSEFNIRDLFKKLSFNWRHLEKFFWGGWICLKWELSTGIHPLSYVLRTKMTGRSRMVKGIFM